MSCTIHSMQYLVASKQSKAKLLYIYNVSVCITVA